MIPTDATPLSPTDVERLRGSLLTADGDLLGPTQVRDFLRQREVAEIWNLSTETLRRQRKNDPRCSRSRFYPYEDHPVFDLDRREPLYHPGGWYPELITEDIANRVRSLLSTWPSDPDWQPGGAKRRKLERSDPIDLPGRRLNPLGSSDGGSYFRFTDSSERRAA